MKTKRPYKPGSFSRSANEQLLKDAHDAMTDAINDWGTPDSPESFCFSMKGIMVIRDRIACRLCLPTSNDKPTITKRKCDQK